MLEKSLFVHGLSVLAASALLVLLSNCGHNPETVSFDRAWVRTPLPSKTTTAAYVQIQNHTKQAITVISAYSATIGSIEFHKSELKDGMHRMVKLNSLEIPASDTLKLEPGDLHLMLFRVQEVEENRHVIKFLTDSDLEFEATFETRETAPE